MQSENTKRRKIESNFDKFESEFKSGVFRDCSFSDGSLWKYNKNGERFRLKGLTNFCREKFWNNFDFPKVYSISKKINPKQKKRTPREDDKWNVVQGQTPRVRGSMIHDQIRLLVMGEHICKRKYPIIDSMSELAIKWLEKKEFDCFVPELCIGDPVLRIGTSIDLLARSKEGELVLIEWKTGNLGVFGTPNAQMTSLPQGIVASNCLYNQARIQVLMSCAILFQGYGIEIDKAYIVLLTNEGRYVVGVNKDFIGYHKEMYRHVLDNVV